MCASQAPPGFPGLLRLMGYTLALWLLVVVSGCTTTGPHEVLESAFTPRDCPPISDHAAILARIGSSQSGAPWTEHPCVDLLVWDAATAYVVRIHFGDLGDGRNVCLPFDECKNTRPLPETYVVETARVQALFSYLARRNFTVGKFTSWGIPVLFAPAEGSNCGDAFVEVVHRLGLPSVVFHDMEHWIKQQGAGKWAFQRGNRHLTDEFYHGAQ